MIKKLLFLLCLLPLLLEASPLSPNTPVITRYHSQIAIQKNGDLLVTEAIAIRTVGKKIKHGLYRDFPTAYKDKLGISKAVNFTVIDATLNEQPVPYETTSMGYGQRVYLGDPLVQLKPGLYRFTLTYLTSRQIGFFQDFDELYWNVTGNYWDFPILRASATVSLPVESASFKTQVLAYTGPLGANGKHFRVLANSPLNSSVSTTRKLNQREGLTIVVQWPKGILAPPTQLQRVTGLVHDNKTICTAAAALLLLLLYYLIIWHYIGRDKKIATVVPRFSPPAGFSPVALCYIRNKGYSTAAFATALINMAVKGTLKIIESDNGKTYQVEQCSKDTRHLGPAEKSLAKALFIKETSLTVSRSNRSAFVGAASALKKTLKHEFYKAYFINNYAFVAIGALITIITTLILAGMKAECGPLIVFTIWGLISLNSSSSRFSWGSLAALAAFAIPFSLHVHFEAAVVTWLLFAMAFVNNSFIRWLKNPTQKGARLLNQVEGFRIFLAATEKERLNFLHPPEKTPELFEQFLPYALALGVEQQWSESFANQLDKVAQRQTHYQPYWYSSNSSTLLSCTQLTSSLQGGFSSALASAGTSPSSSSGGSSGSSGGGGGGGGGGGW